MNWLLFANMLALLIFGVFALYSACWMRDDQALATKWRDQVYWIILGLIFFFVASLVDYKWIKYLGIPVYLVATGMLVFTTFNGVEINGTRAWLSLGGGVLIQPSQLAMAAGLILLALVLSRLHTLHPSLRNPFVRLLVSGIVALIPFGFVRTTSRSMMEVILHPSSLLRNKAAWAPTLPKPWIATHLPDKRASPKIGSTSSGVSKKAWMAY